MDLIAKILIGLVALEHCYILWLEMFVWTTRGPKVFKGLPKDLFVPTKALPAPYISIPHDDGHMQKGLEQTRIHELIMDTNEENRLRLLGHLLSKKMELLHDCHAAIISLDEDEQKQYPLGAGGTEGFVNYPLSLATVILSIFISSKQGEIRMSFRSKGTFNVCEFAQQHFEGGGHFNAAGGRSDLSIPQTIEKLKTIINENKKQLKLCYEELQSL